MGKPTEFVFRLMADEALAAVRLMNAGWESKWVPSPRFVLENTDEADNQAITEASVVMLFRSVVDDAREAG